MKIHIIVQETKNTSLYAGASSLKQLTSWFCDNKKKIRDKTFLHGWQNTFWLVMFPLLEAVWRIITPPAQSCIQVKMTFAFLMGPPRKLLSYLLISWRPCCTGSVACDSVSTLASINVFSRIVMPVSNAAETILNSPTHAHFLFKSACSTMLGKPPSYSYNLTQM